jgi:ribosome biogenesis protein
MTARLARISLSSTAVSSETLATLHLHTSPISSVASNQSGSHLLTAGWDAILGLWNTEVPSNNEVEIEYDGYDSKRRRTVHKDVKRKAPEAILKSHTDRISKAVFSSDGKQAYSCSFDSTIRAWDIENAVCIQTIVGCSTLQD